MLLGTTRYTTSLDLWSAGCVLAEFLLSCPLLPGDTNLEQLSLIVKLLGSPTPTDVAALQALGTPDLRSWLRNDAPKGRPENFDGRFERIRDGKGETISFIRGLLKWDPRERWTAKEALGRGKGDWAKEAKSWWESRPRACRKEDLRELMSDQSGVVGDRQEADEGLRFPDRGMRTDEAAEGAQNQFVFDFEDDMHTRRPPKKARTKA